MKKILPFIIVAFSAFSTKAQDSAAFRNHYMKMYNQALMYNDANTAIGALHGYLAVENNMKYKDTLSMLYFNVKSYYSALMLAEEVYKSVPENVEAMARAAECYDELGDPKTSVSLYEQVVPKTKNPYHIYKMAVGQYQLKRTLECEASARMALADTNSKKVGVTFNSIDGSQQLVPVNAASYNLLGVLKMDAKNFAGAKTDFQQALKLFPDFVGAKGNLDVCDRNLKTGKTPTKQPATKPKG
ncbi:MAG: hypothetical protein HZB42_04690 [Sphingobacteriales bacterium]|nr:hypothetical protein [Sphingobacteriales bacterium]